MWARHREMQTEPGKEDEKLDDSIELKNNVLLIDRGTHSLQPLKVGPDYSKVVSVFSQCLGINSFNPISCYNFDLLKKKKRFKGIVRGENQPAEHVSSFLKLMHKL